MEGSEDTMSSDDSKFNDSGSGVKRKPKKRSLIERELESSLTPQFISPMSGEGQSTSRYGRARRLKTDTDFCDTEKAVANALKSPQMQTKTPVKQQSPAYKMNALKSPVNKEANTSQFNGNKIDGQIENICNVNLSLSRFVPENKMASPAKKVYTRKDMIQSREKDDPIVLIKNMFSPASEKKINYTVKSSEKKTINFTKQNGHFTPSVVKTLDFDIKKKKKEIESKVLSKSDLFALEAQCGYQVGDVAWARMGTFPFWPCIVTREPGSDMFVRKKLFGRIERNMIHVTFFGDNGRRSWILDTMLRKFQGKAEFETAREQFTAEAKKKDPRLYAAFFISEKKQPLWNSSVDEAESLFKEPKRLRIDLLYEMLEKFRTKTPKGQKSGKITRTDSDVSLSESLYDSLFSEDDVKSDDTDKKTKTKRKSLDVSEVVTACLDNMAAKTGMTVIQKQSHMDRWLQKAKSKTPEKLHAKVPLAIESNDKKEIIDKVSKIDKRKKKELNITKKVPTNKPYSLRRSTGESQILLSHHNEHDYSKLDVNVPEDLKTTLNDIGVTDNVESVSNIDCCKDDYPTTQNKTTEDTKTIVPNEIRNIQQDKIKENNVVTLENNKMDVDEPILDNDQANNSEIVDKFSKNHDITEVTENNCHIANQKNKCNGVEANDKSSDNSNFDSIENNELYLSEVLPDDVTELDIAVELNLGDVKNYRIKQNENHIVESDHVESKDEKGDKNNKISKVSIEETVKHDFALNKHEDIKRNEEVISNSDEFELLYDVSPIKEDAKSVSSEIYVPPFNIDVLNKPCDKSNKVENVKEDVTKIVVENLDKVDEVSQKGNEKSINIGDEITENKNSNPDSKNVLENSVKELRICLTPLKKNVMNGHLTPTVDKTPDKSSEMQIYVNGVEENIGTEAKDTKMKNQEDKMDSISNDISNDMKTSEDTITESIQADSIENNESNLSEVLPDDVTELDIAVELNLGDVKNYRIKQNENLIVESDHVESKDEKGDKNNKISKGSVEETIKHDFAQNKHEDLKKNEEVISNSDEFELLYDVSPIKEDAKSVSSEIYVPPFNLDVANKSCDKSNKVENVKEDVTKIVVDKLDNVDEVSQKGNEKSINIGDEITENKDSNPDSKNVLENNVKELRICLTPLKKNVMNGHLTPTVDKTPDKSSEMQTYVNGVEENIGTEAKETKMKNQEDKIDYISNDISNALKTSEDTIAESIQADTFIKKATENGISTNSSETIENINDIDHEIKKNLNEESHIKVIDNLSKETNISIDETTDILNLPIIIEGVDSNNQNDDKIADLDLALTDDMFKAMKSIEGLMTEFDSETTSITSGLTEISSPIKMPVDLLNGLRDSDALKRIKLDLFLDSDTESAGSELDNINLKDLKATLNKNNETNENSSKTNYDKDANDNAEISETESVPKTYRNCRKLSLRLRRSQSPTDNINMNGFHDSKESSPDRKKNDKEIDTISINSEDSTASSTRRRGRKEKQKETEDRSKDPEFLRYLEMRQDNLIDEHPELTHEEIVAYLYKTWLYEENLKTDSKKSDDLDQMTLVKGVNEDLQPKKAKKKMKRLININKVLDKESNNVDKQDVLPKDKPKRKAVQSCYYKEDFSDIEDEIQLFEIFKKKEPTKEQGESSKAVTETIKSPKTKTDTEIIKIEDDVVEEVYYDDDEKYFEEMTKPKPNVFKGYLREKVCDVCEKTSNLVKCKGCSGMFHLDCAKKEPEIVEVSGPIRGRKKKKKPRGRKPKSMDGLDESHSDEKSQEIDENDINNSIDEIKESELITADAETFETEIEAKMKELLDKPEYIDYDSYSSDDGIDWTDSVAGKCEIIDVKLKPKHTATNYADFKCINCQKNEIPICYVCKSAVSPKTQNNIRQRCQVAQCCKYYHLECLDHWPQTQFNAGDFKNKKDGVIEPLTCPRHVCHTCVSDDPRGCKTRFSGDKLARCVRCPATYHSFTKCLPAGSQILTASHIICPRHYQHRPGKVPCHVNTGWCFICALGGTLICCEYCPTSFHAECLNIEPPDGGYMCEDCETGRLPLYGEMVWVKLGHYRWWPGIVLHPSEIPTNIMAIKHSLGEFVVRFFGQYDHYWVNRGRVFPFQEGDSGRISSQKSKIDEAFTKAIEHAQRAFEILKNTEPNQEESNDIQSSLLPPHYVKLKVNKPCGSLIGRRIEYDESSLTQCECRPEEEDPCGPHSHCLNRMLLTECGPNCRTGDRCNNRAFEKRLYPKMTPYRTPHRGWGLKTLEDIKAGQFVIEYVGELIDEEEFRRRMRRKHEIRDENYYFLTLDKERMIDAGPKGNLARFMNHCCEPNCETQKWTVLGDVRVGLFAIKDIPANTEVNFNYNLECAGIEKKRCLCGAKRCSGYMGAKPKQDEPQAKKPKIPAKRTYKKRKNIEISPSTSKIKRPVGRPAKPRELTEIEKDLLIIKNATNGLSSDSEGPKF